MAWRESLRRACGSLAAQLRASPQPMLAMDFIKANRETVERAIRDKGVDLDLDALAGARRAKCAALKTEIEALRAERNAISARFPKAAAGGKGRAWRARPRKRARARRRARRRSWRTRKRRSQTLMLKLPGIPVGRRAGRARRELQHSRPHRRARRRTSTSSRSTMSR